jgi:FkbM family methyltransferase
MDQNTAYDLQAEQVMERVLNERSVCIDIGAHVGSFVDLFLKYAPLGVHYAFEPLPDLCQTLREKYALHEGVKVIETALGDYNGTSTFTHVVSNPGYSGLRERRYDRSDERLQQIEVRVRKLDDVVPSDLTVDFIKIDVEGAELQVLRGGIETLRRGRPCVVFEHGLGAADCYGTEPGDIHALLSGELGFGIHVMERWLFDGGQRPLKAEEFREEFATGRNFYFMAIRGVS